MILSVKEIEQYAKVVGAKENYGIHISVKLRCEWLAWILNRIYKGQVINVLVSCGEIRDGDLWQNSIWNVANIDIDKES
jgi:hypothetical protein